MWWTVAVWVSHFTSSGWIFHISQCTKARRHLVHLHIAKAMTQILLPLDKPSTLFPVKKSAYFTVQLHSRHLWWLSNTGCWPGEIFSTDKTNMNRLHVHVAASNMFHRKSSSNKSAFVPLNFNHSNTLACHWGWISGLKWIKFCQFPFCSG